MKYIVTTYVLVEQTQSMIAKTISEFKQKQIALMRHDVLDFVHSFIKDNNER